MSIYAPVKPSRNWRKLVSLQVLFGALLIFAAPRTYSQDPQSEEPIVLAQLVYGGGKHPECFGDRFLDRARTITTLPAGSQMVRVALDSPELYRYPFAILSGEGGFTLSPTERLALRRYLNQGGTILASAGCSETHWNASFRTEMASLFPANHLATLPITHPVFRYVYDIRQLRTVNGLARNGTERLETININGRIAVFYSPDGLNDAKNAVNCCCCGGDELSQAEFVNVNLLAYALHH